MNAWRGIAVWVMRAASVLMLAVGAYLLLKRLLFGIGQGSPGLGFTIYQSSGEEASAYRGLAMIMVGAALGPLAPRIAAWMIRVPPEDCPRCGYGARDSDRCTECGLDLTQPPTRA